MVVAEDRPANESPDSESIVVTFRLRAPGLSETTEIFITGSVPELGKWTPDKVKMKHDGGDLWVHRLSLSSPQQIEYKYTLGTWKREGARPGRTLSQLVPSRNSPMTNTSERQPEHFTGIR